MFLLNWYKEYLEIKYERAARKKELEFCGACETLKTQLAIANEERKYLIQKLTGKPEVIEDREPQTLKAIMPSRINWNVRRHMLESEDRERAKVLKQREESNSNQSNSGKALTINEIEKELGVDNG